MILIDISMEQGRGNMRDMAGVFKALCDEKRLEIFEQIRRDEAVCEAACCDISEQGNCVSQLARRVGLSQSTVSHHLKELRNAGLIEYVKRGVSVYCRINRDTVETAEAFLRGKELPGVAADGD